MPLLHSELLHNPEMRPGPSLATHTVGEHVRHVQTGGVSTRVVWITPGAWPTSVRGVVSPQTHPADVSELLDYCGQRDGSSHCVELTGHAHFRIPHIWCEGNRHPLTLAGMAGRQELEVGTMTPGETEQLGQLFISAGVSGEVLDYVTGAIFRHFSALQRDMEPLSVALSELLEDDMPDAYRHVEGLPGLSTTCWADVWDDTANDYVACGGPVVNDLGTCATHNL